jgi:CheY-like chemotaxis protein
MDRIKEDVMRASVVVLVISASVLLHGADVLQACGDKFLLVGRGAKFRQAYAAIYPASIVVFAHPQRSSAKAIRDSKLQTDLKRAGHRVSIAEDEAALVKALESDKVDLVLTDVADADRIASQAAGAPAQPRVLPVMFQPTKEEAKAVESKYQCRLTSSDRADRYLVAIDDAMKVRVDQRKKKS